MKIRRYPQKMTTDAMECKTGNCLWIKKCGGYLFDQDFKIKELTGCGFHMDNLCEAGNRKGCPYISSQKKCAGCLAENKTMEEM